MLPIESAYDVDRTKYPLHVNSQHASVLPALTFPPDAAQWISPGLPPRASFPARSAPVTESIIEARSLRKRYSDVVAVDGIDLTIERGHVYGLLGPNGSGKSTTVRMLLGLVAPDAGDVRMFGLPLRGNEAHLLRRVGSVVETPAFIPYLCGRDNLRLLDVYAPRTGPPSVDDVLHRVHLEGAAGRRFKNYSLGMKQRLGIGAAILHDPELVILDEPTNGLDPAGTREVRELIPELAAEGRTILLCSHLLHEVEQVCDYVFIFQKGRVVSEGTTRELVSSRAELEIQLDDIESAERLLRQSPWADRLSRRNGAIYITGASPDAADLNRLLATNGLYASVIRPVSQSLEAVFFEITGESSDV